MKAEIAISIPIPLKNRQEIADRLLDKYGTEYLFIGRVLQETASDRNCAIDIHPINQESGETDVNGDVDRDGDRISVCLTSTDVGYESCLLMARFARIFLEIGGTKVRVESGELNCDAAKWLANYNSEDVFDIYSLYVALIEGEDNYYSCGMNNFGKADVALSQEEDVGLAIYVMNVFNYYRLTESPILKDGHTFKPDIESPNYQLKWIEDRETQPDSYSFNPYGRWQLSRDN